MRVLGVDPGTINMGVGIVDSDGDEMALVYACVLSPTRSSTLAERLHYLYEHLLEIVGSWVPDVVAIEEPFVARNVRSALAVGQAQGVAMVAAAHHGLPVSGYSPREVKRSVTDHGGSSKEQVREMVLVFLSLTEYLEPLDVTDALAVAICHITSSRTLDVVVRE